MEMVQRKVCVYILYSDVLQYEIYGTHHNPIDLQEIEEKKRCAYKLQLAKLT